MEGVSGVRCVFVLLTFHSGKCSYKRINGMSRWIKCDAGGRRRCVVTLTRLRHTILLCFMSYPKRTDVLKVLIICQSVSYARSVYSAHMLNPCDDN